MAVLIWVDKENDADFIMAEDVNKLAKAILDLEKNTNEELDKKLNTALAESAMMVYGANTEGQKTFPVSFLADPSSIPFRDPDGNFFIEKPIMSSHATNKSYVDALCHVQEQQLSLMLQEVLA